LFAGVLHYFPSQQTNVCARQQATFFLQNRACQAGFACYSLPPFSGGNFRRGNEIAAAQLKRFMAVKIRMKRIGAKNAPVFRIVVADGRSPRDGKFIEEIGTYHPRQKGDNVKFDLERVKYWISKGAQPSETVASFIKKASKAAAATAAA
jgi:small subunit ribosomal protein S16